MLRKSCPVHVAFWMGMIFFSTRAYNGLFPPNFKNEITFDFQKFGLHAKYNVRCPTIFVSNNRTYN